MDRRAVERFDELLASDGLEMDSAPHPIVEDLWSIQESFARLTIMTSIGPNRRKAKACPVLKAFKFHTYDLKWMMVSGASKGRPETYIRRVHLYRWRASGRSKCPEARRRSAWKTNSSLRYHRRRNIG